MEALEALARLNNRINNLSDGIETSNSDLDLEAVNMPNVIINQGEIDQQEEILRNEIHNNFEDDDFFYNDHEEEFRNFLDNEANGDLSYEYSNVLNGSENTFGLEIEFVSGDPNAIARDLYDMGICGYDRQVRYHAPSINNKWKLESDVSLPSGGELVSPPLKDNPETWQNIQKVCEVAKMHGARVNSRAVGGHVHISADPLDTAKHRWNRFFKSTGSFEDVIYRVSGGERGIVRSNVNHYATSFSQTADRMLRTNFSLNNSGDLMNLTFDASRSDRYKMINLTNIHDINKPNTLEFRSFNSSLDPKILQNNVRIANGIVFASEKARFGNTSESPSMKRRGLILKDQQIRRIRRPNDLSVRDFVDIAFTRKKDKDEVLKLYSRNTWFNRQE
ncbi:MAG: amidoligase family protein [Clostridiales bacterium]